MSHKPTCVFSESVQISLDELMTELLRRIPEKELAEALLSSATNATKRSRSGRHSRYKVERFFRKASERLVNIPDHLAEAIGLKNEQLPLFEPKKEEELQAEEAPAVVVAPEEPEPAEDLFVPAYEDFEKVFSSYPYVCEHHDRVEGRLLLLGYCSGRDREGRLLRRNCMLTRPNGDKFSFQDLAGIFGTLTHKGPNINRYIKAIPYPEGASIRFWTNVDGVGDLEEYRRVWTAVKH